MSPAPLAVMENDWWIYALACPGALDVGWKRRPDLPRGDARLLQNNLYLLYPIVFVWGPGYGSGSPITSYDPGFRTKRAPCLMAMKLVFNLG